MDNSSKNSYFSWKRGIFLFLSIVFVIVFFLYNPYFNPKTASQTVSTPNEAVVAPLPDSKVDSSSSGFSLKIPKIMNLKDVLGELKNLAQF